VFAVLVISLVPQLTSSVRLSTPADRNLLVHWQATPGTSLTEMARVVRDATRRVRAIPGVVDAAATVGRAVQSDERVNVDAAELWVRLDAAADYSATASRIGRALGTYPGVRSDVMTYGQDRLQNVEAETAHGLVVRVYGIDLGALQQKAEQVRAKIASIAGVQHASVVTVPTQPTLQVEVNLQAAEKSGLKPGDVRRDATTFFSSLPVGSLYLDQAVFDVVVAGTPTLRQSVQNVSDMLLDTPAGDQVRLGDIASVKLAPAAAVINHDATSRYIDVTAAIAARDSSAVVRDVDSAIKSVPMPLEYHAEVLGNLAAQRNDDLRELGVVLAIIAGTALLLHAAFRSLRIAALVLVCVALSGAGGVVAAWFSGGLASMGALVGFLAVLGFAARNLVIVVRDAQQSRGSGALLRAATDRVGPAVLTAAVTIAMMIPLVAAGTAPGAEVLRPLASVVLGGLISTVLVTVLLAPALLAPHVSGRPHASDDADHDSTPVELTGTPAADGVTP
jgi:Cu/Ag efflux pump CusA